MPRRTIADCEAEIADLKELLNKAESNRLGQAQIIRQQRKDEGRLTYQVDQLMTILENVAERLNS